MLLEAFVWPVSAVMKLWHWLLAHVMGVAPDTAWVMSIVLLVITVRSFLVPFNWSTFRSSRMMLLMRPEQEKLEERYGESTDAEDVAAHDKALKDLNKEYGYNPMTGCIPPLVQIPFILGLYRLLMWMSVPENGRTSGNIGLLTPDDIASFLQASFMGAPLPAYVSMSPEQFTSLGTTSADVRAVAIPLLIFALIFTTVNTVVSQLRTRTHMDWDQTVSRNLYKWMWSMVILTPIMLGFVGMTGLIPVALLMYWFLGNLWTLSQSVIMWYLLAKKYPLREVHKKQIHTSRAKVLGELREHRQSKKTAKRSWRRRRIASLAHPGSIAQVRRDIKADKAAFKSEQKGREAEKKSLKKARDKVRSENRKAEMERRREERKRRKEENSSATGSGGPANEMPEETPGETNESGQKNQME